MKDLMGKQRTFNAIESGLLRVNRRLFELRDDNSWIRNLGGLARK
jgi:hypothetical protein